MEPITQEPVSKRIEGDTQSPVTRHESKETVPDRVTVYRVIDKTALLDILANGVTVRESGGRHERPELEDIFMASAMEHGITVNRSHCIFAHPRHPLDGRYSSRIGDNQVIIEMDIDPTGAIVTNQEMYTEAAIGLERYKSTEHARDYADAYWEDAMPLTDYLKATVHDDFPVYTIPEVLIPTTHIDAVHVRLCPIQAR